MCGKSLLSVVLLFVLFIYEPRVVKSQDFGYSGQKGPSHWGEQYNSCKGKHQSPININTVDLLYVSMPPLKFVGFKTPPQVTSLTNNGHTVQVKMESEIQPQVSGGPLHGVYEFSQFHFHWGENDTYGSEDTINSHSYPMGIHLVFYKKNYRSARTAMDYPDGLTVLSLFYEVAEEDNPAYDEFARLLDSIARTSQSTSFEDPPSIFDLIKTDFSDYYSYNGSLTTPPCSEVVTWIDFAKPIPLSHDQIAKFRSLKDEDGNKLTHNFRPIQPLNERIVLANSAHSDDPDYQPKFVDPVPMPSSINTDPPTTITQLLSSTTSPVAASSTTSAPPVTTISTTEAETDSTIEYEIDEGPSTKNFHPVEPLSTKPTTETSASTTPDKVSFPDSITEIPNNNIENVTLTTQKTQKAEHHRSHGKGGQPAAVEAQSLFTLLTTVIVLLTATNLAPLT